MKISSNSIFMLVEYKKKEFNFSQILNVDFKENTNQIEFFCNKNTELKIKGSYNQYCRIAKIKCKKYDNTNIFEWNDNKRNNKNYVLIR